MKVRKSVKRHQKKRIFKQPQAMTSKDVAVQYAEKIAKAAAYVQEKLHQISAVNASKKTLSMNQQMASLLASTPNKMMRTVD